MVRDGCHVEARLRGSPLEPNILPRTQALSLHACRKSCATGPARIDWRGPRAFRHPRFASGFGAMRSQVASAWSRWPRLPELAWDGWQVAKVRPRAWVEEL